MRLNKEMFKFSLKTRAIAMCGVWVIVGIIAFFCSATGHQVTQWTKGVANLSVQKAQRQLSQVSVTWREQTHYTKTDEILKTIHLDQGMDMSKIDLDDIRIKVEKLPWVRAAVVERYWPNHLKITIEEKMPLALWQHNKKYHPLDEFAHVIATTKQLPADLLLVVGPDAPQHLLPLLKELEQVPDIYQYVRAAVRVSERRWTLKLFDVTNGVEVVLPEKGIHQALIRLDEHNKKEKLIKRQVASIDLRNPNKVVLEPLNQPKKKASKK
ncbi:MAG: FtsQ-type POTRA domain-containing protein [Alphaproteobacteria bacterium]|nr:FtsQ-type POTRA domain-containing protein [Alphaproteobacteria bacterium]